MTLLISSLNGICQKSTNHCFDSIEIKKISYIIFERDYLKTVNEELFLKEELLSADRDRLLYSLKLSDSISNDKSSIIKNNESEISYLKQTIFSNGKRYKKEKRLGIGVIILLTIITLIK